MINIVAVDLMIVVILLAISVGSLVYEFRQERENEKKRKIIRLQMLKDEKLLISYQKLIQLLGISLVYDDGWSRDGNYCKKEIYSNKLVGPDKPYLIGYVVIDVNTLEVSTELNDFYNPIYTKKEFEDISISILKEIKERLSEFKKENKNEK